MKKFYCPFHYNFWRVLGLCYRNRDYTLFHDEFNCRCNKNEYFGSIEAILSHCQYEHNWYHDMLHNYLMKLHYKDHDKLSQLFISNRSSDYESDEGEVSGSSSNSESDSNDSESDDDNANNNGEGVARGRNLSDR